MSDRRTIAIVFATLEAGGVRQPPSFGSEVGWNFALDLWAGILSDTSAEDLVAATTSFLRSPEARFWPTPGQLLEHVPGRRSFEDADATWGEVLTAAGRKGRANPPVLARELRGMPADGLSEEELERLGFGRAQAARAHPRRGEPWAFDEEDDERDQSIHCAIASIGGWRALCILQDDQIVPARASFRSAYRSDRARLRARRETTTARTLLESGEVRALTDRRKR